MKIITNVTEMQALAKELKKTNSIGFVPTMGYLHEGHLQLIRKAREENDITIVSIFVNPLQFGPNEDFATYPRDFERDVSVCLEEGVDIIFNPSVAEMYPKPLSVKVLAQARTDVLCGNSRPGHFDGVATVLTKLFHLILPDRVYLGMKDAQQVAVVEGLIADFNFPIELIPVPTVREEDGLAKSSRNVNLMPEEREQAPEIYRALLAAKNKIEAGERSIESLVTMIRNDITQKTSGTIDYVEIYSFPDLQTIEKVKGKIIIAIAVQFTKVRLIDNMVLSIE
ncbi:pantoate--beta-alanine ligase [Robertmurraya sp. DFI.2.37]|uniref:pantoate--beta-alanine ligase n=1 Tax=Robertmurraya sp. DFI.2.37 TaxID=3031819 RepID=UPI001244C8E5|nr:pantoate--beta-alanine ligase [Robertmurraya sp. DFI.2.37]MDF1507750.1 pantoate--beta-alanine ligase [Robertmurraya sp. DFI.2.37]